MGAHNKNLKIAVGLQVITFILIFFAFILPYWLVADGKLAHPKFLNLGLWTACFRNFQDIHRFYDVRFNGCMWVFEEEYYIIHDYLLPGFYIAVQLFFTLTFTLTLIAAIMSIALFRFERDDDRYIALLLSTGASLVLGSICGLIACITWGLRGDGRDWMPNWEHNDMGFAFAFACVGVCFLMPCGVLYMAEARRERYKRLNDIGTREASAYSIGEDIRRYQQRQAEHIAN